MTLTPRPALPMAWCYLVVVVFAIIVLIFALCPPVARGESPELFKLFRSNILTDATPMQTERIDQIKQRRTTKSMTLVQVDVAALSADSVRMSLPEAEILTLSRQKMDVINDKDFTWFGSLLGVPGAATIVVRDGNATGTIRSETGLYRVEPVGGGVHALIKVDESRFPPEHPPSFKEKERRGDNTPLLAPHDAPTADAPAGIDVLVAYTAAARMAVTDIAATIQLAVAEANQSYQNSGINLRLTLVDSFEVSYSESGKSFETILADFVGMADVNTRRTNFGADMAAMIINQADYCGLADAICATAATAFALVHYDCATGYYSFAHELGHLQGARHDLTNDPTSGYCHGLQHLVPPPSWRTIMAYSCTGGCPRLQYWSNPNVNYNTVPMGTAATNDNARCLNETAATVAAFKSRPFVSSAGSIWRYTGSPCSGNSCPGWQKLDNNSASVRIAAGS